MSLNRLFLDEHSRARLQTTVAFLEGRLSERATVEWAIGLKQSDQVQRIAVQNLLLGNGARKLTEPWRTAWRLIEESWSNETDNDPSGIKPFGIKDRLQRGERSSVIINQIVGVVTPSLVIDTLKPRLLGGPVRSKAPRTFRDVMSVRVAGGRLLHPKTLGLDKIKEVQFLLNLAVQLQAAVTGGLDLARRIGWDGHRQQWIVGRLRRIDFISSSGDRAERDDPDAYAHGIAPSVKLLYAVISQISVLDPAAALPLVTGWKAEKSVIGVRLWAAAARNAALASAEEVSDFLEHADDWSFWEVQSRPEVSELRSLRFHEFTEDQKARIVARIRKGPPRKFWQKNTEPERIASARLYWSVRELKRIDIVGGGLSNPTKAWLSKQLKKLAVLENMGSDQDFPEGPTVRTYVPLANPEFDSLEGVARLDALERALRSQRAILESDPASRANDWILKPGNAQKLLQDLLRARSGGDDFPAVWGRFGWAHKPAMPSENSQPTLQAEAAQVFKLIHQLSDRTISEAIAAITQWLDAWDEQVAGSPLGLEEWFRIWPLALSTTNTSYEATDAPPLRVGETNEEEGEGAEQLESATLNTPIGKMVSVFFKVCANLTPGTQAFSLNSVERRMRDEIIAASGKSELIVKHRLIQELPYFMNADPAWAEQYLVAPLMLDNADSRALWQAVSRQRSISPGILSVLGPTFVNRATDRRLARETREGLAFQLVVSTLHTLSLNQSPVIPHSQIQQMLRMSDDELRGFAAGMIEQFVKENSSAGGELEDAHKATNNFRTAAKPFLQKIWPQELSLRSASVGGAFARLPASSGDAFAEAVNSVERFLVPFDCWSMLDYGLYGEDQNHHRRLASIDNDEKAEAFLRLLDATIGDTEGATIPTDLAEALDQIQATSPRLGSSPAFRRLSTAARRI